MDQARPVVRAVRVLCTPSTAATARPGQRSALLPQHRSRLSRAQQNGGFFIMGLSGRRLGDITGSGLRLWAGIGLPLFGIGVESAAARAVWGR